MIKEEARLRLKHANKSERSFFEAIKDLLKESVSSNRFAKATDFYFGIAKLKSQFKLESSNQSYNKLINLLQSTISFIVLMEQVIKTMLPRNTNLKGYSKECAICNNKAIIIL